MIFRLLFQIDSTTEVKLGFSELSVRSERLAAGLQKFAGVGKDDVVGILSVNHNDFITSCLAVNLITAKLQPLNPMYTKGGFSFIYFFLFLLKFPGRKRQWLKQLS